MHTTCNVFVYLLPKFPEKPEAAKNFDFAFIIDDLTLDSTHSDFIPDVYV